MATELIAICALVILLVFLSTLESAYESLSEVSLRVMLSDQEDSPRGKFFAELIEHRLRFELILVFGTQSSIVLAAIILFDAANRSSLPFPFVLAFIFAILIVMLFRQLVPRLIAQNRPEKVLWGLLPFFRFYHRLFYPVIAPIQLVLSRTRQLERANDQEEAGDDETKEEIQAFIDVGEEQGIIEESEGEMIQSIVEFSDTRVTEVMRPRPQIVAIQSTATVSDARSLMMESKFSRIPVYRDHLDNIEGFIHVRDILALCEPDKLSLPVTECMRPAYFVPESKPVAELLEEMQKAKVQTAIVIDEFGGVSGLVTIEDIVEEIVGEIED
ncbi:MAG TPA: hemolysin family protein [Blastocatellia bacterium]|nr:hemolysin family protein [Blastocatellia bacterium]